MSSKNNSLTHMFIRMVCFAILYSLGPLPWKDYGNRTVILQYFFSNADPHMANTVMNVIWVAVLVFTVWFEVYSRKKGVSSNPFDYIPNRYDPVEHAGELGPKDHSKEGDENTDTK